MSSRRAQGSSASSCPGVAPSCFCKALAMACRERCQSPGRGRGPTTLRRGAFGLGRRVHERVAEGRLGRQPDWPVR
eukprot:11179422-Lingulodinium_polyedra.AAC.1